MDLAAFELLHPSFDPALGLLVLELEHGKANEIGVAELDAFEEVCRRATRSQAVRCICTTSRRVGRSGKPIFVAGANVTERLAWDEERVRDHVERQRKIMRKWRRMPVFTVAVTHGATLGWGLEFCLANDYVMATRAASFGLPETGLGIVPGAGGTADLSVRIGISQALRLGCTGEVVDAEEAARVGLVDELVGDVDAGLERARSLALLLCRRSPTAVATFKRATLEGIGRSDAERLDLERQAYAHAVATGEAAIGRAHFEAVLAGETPPWGPRSVGPTDD